MCGARFAGGGGSAREAAGVCAAADRLPARVLRGAAGPNGGDHSREGRRIRAGAAALAHALRMLLPHAGAAPCLRPCPIHFNALAILRCCHFKHRTLICCQVFEIASTRTLWRTGDRSHVAVQFWRSSVCEVLLGLAWQVCQMEHQLFEHFFPESESDSGSLSPLMDPLCTILYDALRPVFIQLQSLDELCGLVDILQHEVSPLPCEPSIGVERGALLSHCRRVRRFSGGKDNGQVLEEQLGRRGDAVAPLRPVLLRTVADVQERLTFRAQAFIKVVHILCCGDPMKLCLCAV